MSDDQIYKAMLAIQSEVEAIGRDSTNRDQGYAFRSADAITAHLQPLFKKHGVFCVPVVEHVERDAYTTGRGTVMHNQRMTVVYRFYAVDGSFVEAKVVGEGADSSDKCSSKALTMAQKYALAQVFTIPWSDAEDADRETPEGPFRPPAQRSDAGFDDYSGPPDGDLTGAPEPRDQGTRPPLEQGRGERLTQAGLQPLVELAKQAAKKIDEHPFRTLDTGLKALGLTPSEKGTRSWKAMELHLLQTLAGQADLAALRSVIKNRAGL